jgi:alpha/beta superfamily hydrolase
MTSDSPSDDFHTPGDNKHETVHLTTADNVSITTDIDTPPSPRALATLLHPHPLYGGRRDHPLLLKLSQVLNSEQIATARNDFRRASGNTVDEMPDAIVACEELKRRHPELPLVITGYSFGSIVAGRVASQVGARHLVMIAPPLSTLSLDVPDVPTTLVVAEHDQFSPPSSLEDHPIANRADVHVLSGADHFLNGFIETTTTLVVGAVTTALDV